MFCKPSRRIIINHLTSLSFHPDALSKRNHAYSRPKACAREAREHQTKYEPNLFHHYSITITKIYNENHNEEDDTALFAVHYQLHTSVLTGPHTVGCLSSVVGSARRTSSSPHYDANAVTKHRQTQERANEPTNQRFSLPTRGYAKHHPLSCTNHPRGRFSKALLLPLGT